LNKSCSAPGCGWRGKGLIFAGIAAFIRSFICRFEIIDPQKNISCGLLAKARTDKFIDIFSINAASGIPQTPFSEARAKE
jgi:hypothetical protein